MLGSRSDIACYRGRDRFPLVARTHDVDGWSMVPAVATLEATFSKGVHVGVLADYVDRYDGDLVVARRSALSPEMFQAELDRGFSLLDDSYDWQQEVSIVARKLIKSLPLIEPKKELYCSGLQYAMSLATPYPLQRFSANYPTPEDNWTDTSVIPVCALVKSA